MSGLVYRNTHSASGIFLALAFLLFLSAPLSVYTAPFLSNPRQPASSATPWIRANPCAGC